MTVLVVDAANVVGSRPDGWWRDRAGATERLLVRLGTLPGRTLDGAVVCTAVTAVVEGRARDVAAPDGVDVVRAPGSGDDALVEYVTRLAGDDVAVLVVTADRAACGVGCRAAWRCRVPAGCWGGSTRSIAHHRHERDGSGVVGDGADT